MLGRSLALHLRDLSYQESMLDFEKHQVFDLSVQDYCRNNIMDSLEDPHHMWIYMAQSKVMKIHKFLVLGDYTLIKP